MAPVIDVAALDGDGGGTFELDGGVFGIEPHAAVLHQVVNAQRAAARRGTQSTKTRAEVSGGGRKPFKQKGTGRARQGSERAPQFTGGGIALGPKPRSYRQHTPKKMVALALRSALSDRAGAGRVVVVERWPWAAGADAAPSTRAAREALTSLEIDGRALVVLSREDELAYKSFRNLTDVQVTLAGELSAYDVLVNDWIIFTRETVPGELTPVVASIPDEAPAPGPAVEPAPEGPVAGEPVAGEPVAGEPVAGEPVAETTDETGAEEAR
jgi:large subunit ribosomal protein L4